MRRGRKLSWVLAAIFVFTAMFGGTAYMEGAPAASSISSGGSIVQAVSMSANVIAFLTEDGNVYVNGDNSKGLYGNNSIDMPYDCGKFVKVTVDGTNPLSGIDRIFASGGSAIFAWDEDSGKLYSWGDNGFLRLGIGSETATPVMVAKEVDFFGKPIKFAGDMQQSLILSYGTVLLIDKSGKVWSWGQAGAASINPGGRTIDFRLGREVSVSPEDSTDTAENDSNGNGIIVNANAYVSKMPGIVEFTTDAEERAIAICGGNFWASYILTNKGNVYAFGGTSISPDAEHRFVKLTPPYPDRKFVRVSASAGGAAILLDDAGEVYTMNESNTLIEKTVPTKPAAIYGDGAKNPGNPEAAGKKFIKVVAAGPLGKAVFYAMSEEGQVYVWGSNNMSMAAMGTSPTGDGGVASYSIATASKYLQDADDLNAYNNNGVMLKNGRLYTWGNNTKGQLANGVPLGTASGTPAEVLADNLAGGGISAVVDPKDVAPTPPPKLPNPYGADFMINNSHVLVDNFVGWGGQFNATLYADITAHEYGTTPENVKDLEQKVINLGPQHVRIFYDPDPENVVYYDGKNKVKGQTVVDPNYESFYKVVELAQKSGSTVNLTYWHGPYPDPAGQMKKFANDIYDLIINKKLDCVQYITIENEPNSNNDLPLDLYQTLYRKLDGYLKELGIRNRVKIIGGDLVYNDQATWFQYMTKNMNDILDGYSVHIYWDFFDRKYGESRLTSVRSVMDKIPYSKQKPLYITEYGVRGYRGNNNSYFVDPGASAPDTPNAIAVADMLPTAFQHAWFNIMAANLGYVGLSKWDCFQAKYDTGMQNFSMIGKGSDGYPLRASYNQLLLMTSLVKPGWKVVGAESGSNSNGKLAAAFLGPKGEQTIFALNDTASTTQISIGGLAAGKSYTYYYWNNSGNGLISYGGMIQSDANGIIRVDVNKDSFTAITTLPLEGSSALGNVGIVTRAQFAAMVAKEFKLQNTGEVSKFTDVKESDWFYKDVCAVSKAGLIIGRPDGTFGPDEYITRQDMAAMTARILAGIYNKAVPTNTETYLGKFTDKEAIDAYATLSAAMTIRYDIMQALPGNSFGPGRLVSKAEAESIINKLLNLK